MLPAPIIDFLSKGRVSNVSKMACFGPSADHRLLHLHKVADLCLRSNLTAGPEMGEGSDDRLVLNLALFNDGTGTNGHLVAHDRVGDDRIGFDDAPFTNPCSP